MKLIIVNWWHKRFSYRSIPHQSYQFWSIIEYLCSEPLLDILPKLLNRVQLGTIRWQKYHFNAIVLDELLYLLGLVPASIISNQA